MSSYGRDLAYSLDAALFAREVLGLDADAAQERLLRSRAPMVALCCTRQWGKSTAAAAAAVHHAAYGPASGRPAVVVCTAPVGRQTAELGLKIEAGLAKLPDRLGRVVRRDAELGLFTAGGARIVLLPGREANVRGVSGCTLLLVDEASRVPDPLYKAVRPMLATTAGSTWLLSTPFGRRGFFYESVLSDAWEVCRVPATECARISPAFLEAERLVLGEQWFSQEYLCEFLELQSPVFGPDVVLRSIDPTLQEFSL